MRFKQYAITCINGGGVQIVWGGGAITEKSRRYLLKLFHLKRFITFCPYIHYAIDVVFVGKKGYQILGMDLFQFAMF